MKRVLHSDFSGHTLYVESVENIPDFKYTDAYTKFYVVRNWDENGCVFMYLGKGHTLAPHEVVVWYPKGSFWSGYGASLKTAVEGAQRDGWLYA